jgi:hypothetical protein
MSNEFATVFTTNKDWEANLVKGYLEEAEVPVRLSFEAWTRVVGFVSGPLAEIRVQVLPNDEPRAMEIVDEYRRQVGEQ